MIRKIFGTISLLLILATLVLIGFMIYFLVIGDPVFGYFILAAIGSGFLAVIFTCITDCFPKEYEDQDNYFGW